MHRNMMVAKVSNTEEDVETENVVTEYIIEADNLEDTEQSETVWAQSGSIGSGADEELEAAYFLIVPTDLQYSKLFLLYLSMLCICKR